MWSRLHPADLLSSHRGCVNPNARSVVGGFPVVLDVGVPFDVSRAEAPVGRDQASLVGVWECYVLGKTVRQIVFKGGDYRMEPPTGGSFSGRWEIKKDRVSGPEGRSKREHCIPPYN
jgi:hypothetical protein